MSFPLVAIISSTDLKCCIDMILSSCVRNVRTISQSHTFEFLGGYDTVTSTFLEPRVRIIVTSLHPHIAFFINSMSLFDSSNTNHSRCRNYTWSMMMDIYIFFLYSSTSLIRAENAIPESIIGAIISVYSLPI